MLSAFVDNAIGNVIQLLLRGLSAGATGSSRLSSGGGNVTIDQVHALLTVIIQHRERMFADELKNMINGKDSCDFSHRDKVKNQCLKDD